MNADNVYTEIPSHLQQLVRLVVRGFYCLEDALLIDMLVRNPCMKEDDICELLKFERKMLRSRMTTLKNDKFIQIRLKMETGSDGKVQKVNYYFIDYKMFVNVVKYKLDHMRKKLETEERDATSRASFKCPNCEKAFTDLEADQLFDHMEQEYRCTFCRHIVEEDQSAIPKKDSRLMLARFNEQMEPIYELLRRVEGIKLAPELLEPEPTDVSVLRGEVAKHTGRPHIDPNRSIDGAWSGDATRSHGFHVDENRVDINIGEDTTKSADTRKEAPVWMVDSTIQPKESIALAPGVPSLTPSDATSSSKPHEDIMSFLLANERKPDQQKAYIPGGSDSEESGHNSDKELEKRIASFKDETLEDTLVGEMTDEDDGDADDNVPVVSVNGQKMIITDVMNNTHLIQQMTAQEKIEYNKAYQDYYADFIY